MERSTVMRRNRSTGRLTRDGVGAHVWHFWYYKRNKKGAERCDARCCYSMQPFYLSLPLPQKVGTSSTRDTWVPPKKGNSTSSKMASAETCGKSSESSEDVRSTQASSDKDSSSPLLIKTVFAVISEDMIR